MRLIALTGIDGCGKSTHARHLAATLGGPAGPAPVFGVWDLTRCEEFRYHPFIGDRSAIHGYLGRLHGGARALFILHAFFEAWARLPGQPPVAIADGFWYKYVFTEALHGEELAWLEQVASRLPAPALTILLDVPPGVAWGRKPKVTPYECGFRPPGEATFLDFQTRLRERFMASAAVHGWVVVDGNRPEDEVATDIVRRVSAISDGMP